MFFSSIKEITRLWKKKKKIIKERNVKYLLKSYYWEEVTRSKLRFSKFKKFISRPVFVELQVTQISLNFQTFFSNLKIRGLEAKICVACLLFLFWKELWRFLELMLFVKQKYINFNKNETDLMENYTYSLRYMNHVLQLL